jgi:hypothetical protein
LVVNAMRLPSARSLATVAVVMPIRLAISRGASSHAPSGSSRFGGAVALMPLIVHPDPPDRSGPPNGRRKEIRRTAESIPAA